MSRDFYSSDNMNYRKKMVSFYKVLIKVKKNCGISIFNRYDYNIMDAKITNGEKKQWRRCPSGYENRLWMDISVKKGKGKSTFLINIF